MDAALMRSAASIEARSIRYGNAEAPDAREVLFAAVDF